ncbi:MAG: glucarate dehydratase [Cyclobacteriaceae bacterium]|jgi:glucarate dehydratase
MTGLTIKDIVITPIAIADPPLLNAAGLHAPYALRTIVELVTHDNIVGISEIPGNVDIDKALEEAKEIIIGKDPFQLNTIRDAIEDYFDQETTAERGDAPWDQRKIVHVFSAFEVACLDIIGKVLERPVVDLLGGKRRDSVPFAAYLFYKYKGAGGELGFDINPQSKGWDAVRQAKATTPDEIVQQAIGMVNEFGFQSIKLKGGAFEPQLEVDAIKALFEHFGDNVPLRLDPNAIWKLETAIEYGKQLEGYLEYFEDPVRGQGNMAEARKVLKIPFATNMCTTSFEDIPQSILLDSEDIILSDHHFWGGLKSSMELAKLCQTFGRKMSMHSNSHLGISLAAMVHLGAALPEVPYALDTHYPWQSDEVIVGGRMKFEQGSVPVPSGPGLGVEIDRGALSRLHQNYIECGLTKRDDLVEMRKVIPDWEFRKERW